MGFEAPLRASSPPSEPSSDGLALVFDDESEAAGGPLSTLLVEDSEGDAALLQSLLEEVDRESLRLSRTTTLADALERVRAAQFDVVLLDLELPDSAAAETLRRFREGEQGLPVVVLTGQDDRARGVAALREGADDFLVKGRFDGEALVRAVLYARERKLRASLEGEAARSREVSRLAAGIADRVANPVTAVLMNLELAQRSLQAAVKPQSASADPGLPEPVLQTMRETAETFEELHSSMTKLAAVVAELAAFARGETSRPSWTRRDHPQAE